MKFTPEVAKQIWARFDEVAPNARCPLCGSEQFTVANGFVDISVLDKYPTLLGPKGERGLPCAALICTICGNTFLLNLLTLKLEKLLDIEPEKW